MYQITRYSINNKCLIPWIKHIWHFEAENANIHNKLLPTDSIDVVLNFSSNMIYEINSQKISAPSFHINGLRDKFSYIHQTGNINVIGISFFSFGLFPFIHKSLERTQNKIVDLHILSTKLDEKFKEIVTSNFITGIIENIEQILCSELHVDNKFKMKANLLNKFIETDDYIKVEDFCKRFCINIKTFERMVLHHTGYLPKTLRRIKRFQNTGNCLIYQNKVNLSALAYDNNFTDQAHFTKEFHKFTGTTPQKFTQEKVTVKENIMYKYV